MNVKKVDLSFYEISIPSGDGTSVKVPYDFRNSIADIILAPQLKLNGSALLKNWKVAEKVTNCKEDFVLFTFEEYLMLKNSTEEVNVFSKNDVELIRRIHEATDVEVEEKK